MIWVFLYVVHDMIYIYIYIYIQTDSLQFKKSAVPLNGSTPLFILLVNLFHAKVYFYHSAGVAAAVQTAKYCGSGLNVMLLLFIRCLWEYVDPSGLIFLWRLFIVELVFPVIVVIWVVPPGVAVSWAPCFEWGKTCFFMIVKNQVSSCLLELV